MLQFFYETAQIRLEWIGFEQQSRALCGARCDWPLLVGLACTLRTAGAERTGEQSRAYESAS